MRSVAKEFCISTSRVQQIVSLVRRRKDDAGPDWTDGLTTRSKNALKRHGFTSKNEVLQAFEKNEIYCKKTGGGGTVAELGKKGIAEVRLWLGLPPARVQRTLAELGHADFFDALRHAEEMRSALRVIHTWAGVPCSLDARRVRELTAKALHMGANAKATASNA